MNCPAEIANILLNLISLGILRIRAYSSDQARCVIEADHIHNLPQLIRNYSHSLLLYYWEVERPAFIEQISDADRTGFESLWDELAVYAESGEIARAH